MTVLDPDSDSRSGSGSHSEKDDKPSQPRPTWQIEYATYKPEIFSPPSLRFQSHNVSPNTSELYPSGTTPARVEDPWLPIPLHMITNSTSLLEEILPYKIDDGTIGSWLDLMRRIGDDDDGLGDVFYKFMYLGGEPV